MFTQAILHLGHSHLEFLSALIVPTMHGSTTLLCNVQHLFFLDKGGPFFRRIKVFLLVFMLAMYACMIVFGTI